MGIFCTGNTITLFSGGKQKMLFQWKVPVCTRTVLCGCNTQYFPHPSEHSLKTSGRAPDLTGFRHSLTSQELLIFHQFYLLKWRQSHVLLSHFWRDFNLEGAYFLELFHVMYVTWLEIFWAESSVFGFYLPCPFFPPFQCTDLWLLSFVFIWRRFSFVCKNILMGVCFLHNSYCGNLF